MYVGSVVSSVGLFEAWAALLCSAQHMHPHSLLAAHRLFESLSHLEPRVSKLDNKKIKAHIKFCGELESRVRQPNGTLCPLLLCTLGHSLSTPPHLFMS